jgi:plasmid stabilization system protein ParE
MRFNIIFGPEAQEHLAGVIRWVQAERGGDLSLLRRELRAAAMMLAELPNTGPPYLLARQAGVRRLLLRKSCYHLYYRIDRERGEVYILALWHTARKRPPRL